MTSWRDIGLVLTCTLCTSAAQIFYKAGVKHLPTSIGALAHADALLALWPIAVGLALYGVGALLLIIALRTGDLSVLYPIIATGFIWVALLSSVIFGDALSLQGWLGIVAIMIGVSLIGIGSRKTVSSPVSSSNPGEGHHAR